MDAAIESYDRAWNAADADARRALLEAALSDDCELIEPNGRFGGREQILQRITGFADRFPGATVKIVTNIDTHNGFARYGWEIVDAGGNPVLEGIDVVEASQDNKIQRILMFFGTLSTT